MAAYSLFREGDAWDTLKGAFKGSAAGCGILNISSGIVAEVNARENSVRFYRHDIEAAHTNAVSGGTGAGKGVNVIDGEIAGKNVDAVMKRDAMGGGTSFGVRGDDPDAAEFYSSTGKADNTVRRNTVVISNENNHWQ